MINEQVRAMLSAMQNAAIEYLKENGGGDYGVGIRVTEPAGELICMSLFVATDRNLQGGSGGSTLLKD